MMIHEITPLAGKYKDRKRIGRGHGSGTGKQAGRGKPRLRVLPAACFLAADTRRPQPPGSIASVASRRGAGEDYAVRAPPRVHAARQVDGRRVGPPR